MTTVRAGDAATRLPEPIVSRTQRVRTGTGARLAVDRYDTDSDALVVVSHGIFCNRRMPELRRLAHHLAGRFDVAVYDVRGHGDSDGRFTFGAREWEDLGDVVAACRADYRVVAGVGFSFGALHTCVAAAKLGCFEAVTLVSGPKSFGILDHNPLTRDLVETVRLGRRRPRRPTRLALTLERRTMPIDCIGEIGVPIHLIHGDRDWLIHHKHAEALYARASSPRALTILHGGFHAEYLVTQMPERFLPALTNWLAQQMSMA